jgi:hypothetical protein
VVELFPNLIFLKRNSPSKVDIFDRSTERVLRQNTNAGISSNTWHNLTIWVEGSRIFIYLDRQLALTAEDLILPHLSSGQILLQTNNTVRPVRIDDFIIQRAEPFSDHFQGATLPSTWRTTNTVNATIGVENDGNQYIRMENDVEVNPVMSPVSDFTLRCRLWSQNGGYQFYLRESLGGSMYFDADAGNLTLSQLDGAGAVVTTQRITNFYTRDRWQNLSITFLGDRLEIYLDGRSRFEDTLVSSPAAGTLRFVTGNADILRIDDCLFTQAATASNAGAAFAFALQAEVLARDFRWLRSDLDEHFDNVFRTQDWWQGGTRAAGEFLTDSATADHQNFLRITHEGRPTFRLFRDVIGLEMFGAGTDRRNYRDSTDLYTTVDVRFPEGTAGTAWLATRAEPSISGAELNGYFYEIRRNRDGSTDFVVRYQGPTEQTTFFEGPIPGGENEVLPDWITMVAISYHDQLAFFANGRFVTSIDNAVDLGGSIALGVNEGATVDFDTLIIRDTTPHG